MAEAGASDATLMAVAGHMSRRMLEHYSHVRMAAVLALLGIKRASSPPWRIVRSLKPGITRARISATGTSASIRRLAGPSTQVIDLDAAMVNRAMR